MPPAARNLFEKRFLDFQKLFIRMVWILFFPSCPSWFTYFDGGF